MSTSYTLRSSKVSLYTMPAVAFSGTLKVTLNTIALSAATRFCLSAYAVPAKEALSGLNTKPMFGYALPFSAPSMVGPAGTPIFRM